MHIDETGVGLAVDTLFVFSDLCQVLHNEWTTLQRTFAGFCWLIGMKEYASHLSIKYDLESRGRERRMLVKWRDINWEFCRRFVLS